MPIATQTNILNCTTHKVQLIDIICEQIIKKVINVQPICRSFKYTLIVTGSNLIHQQAYAGLHKEKEDMTTTHEETDVNIPQ